MKAEFLRDENNNIWFSNAKDIHVRRAINKIGLQDLGTTISDEKMIQVKAAQKA